MNQPKISDKLQEAIQLAVKNGWVNDLPEQFRKSSIINPEILEPDWEKWCYKFFPEVCTSPFGDRHHDVWNWAEALRPGIRPRPKVIPWPRGAAKSSTAEMITARLGCTLERHFVLYISETQEQADEHVQNIAELFAKLGIFRAVDSYGRSKGWKRNQLRTLDGFNVSGIGLDVAKRGVKIEGYRPDMLILDDVDGRHDSPEVTRKKKQILQESLIPAGSADLAILFAENLIKEDSIMDQLVKGTAGFLLDCELSPAIPAVDKLEVDFRFDPEIQRKRYFIIGGKATWEGQNLKTCEKQINDWGLDAFLREANHEVEGDKDGGLWSKADIDDHRKVINSEELTRICVAIDPNASEGGDEAGIIVAGCKVDWMGDRRNHCYILEDATVKGGPKKWAEAAVSAYDRWKADFMVAESNQGGEMVQVTVGTIDGAPPVKLIHAWRGKIIRAEPVQKLYSDGRVHHAGEFAMLEREMTRYRPGTGQKSPNRMDAAVYCVLELLTGTTNTAEALLEAVRSTAVTNTSGRVGKYGGSW